MPRKSVEPKPVKTDLTKEVYIVKVKRDPKVEDFLPSYRYVYDGIENDIEANGIYESFIEFLKDHEEVVLQEYSSKDMEAVQEGFKKAVAMVELFFQSMYIDKEKEDG